MHNNYIYIYINIHTNKKETRKTVGLLISTEKGHGIKEWKEAEYYNVNRMEGTRKTKRRVQRQRDY